MEIFSTIHYDSIVVQVFDLFNLNYFELDGDSQLLLRKLNYVFTQMPTKSQEQSDNLKELECLQEANKEFMKFIVESRKQFQELQSSPLKSREFHFQMPIEFKAIYTQIRQMKFLKN